MKDCRTLIIASILSWLSLFPSNMVFASNVEAPTYKPATGYVPDEETAISIAIAVWNPIYGKENIEKQKPYTAVLKNGVWYVRGSLPKPASGGERVAGGVAEAEIFKEDGRIIRVIHGK